MFTVDYEMFHDQERSRCQSSIHNYLNAKSPKLLILAITM